MSADNVSFGVRMPRWMVERLDELAARSDRSRNAVVRMMILKALSSGSLPGNDHAEAGRVAPANRQGAGGAMGTPPGDASEEQGEKP